MAFFKYYWPAVLWALFVFLMCSIDLHSVPESTTFFPGFDKLVHCGFFFLIVVLISYGLIKQQSALNISYTAIVVVMIAAIIYGGTIELLQKYIFTWRDGDWNDLFADTVGAAMGAFSVSITINGMRYVKK